MFGCEKQKQEEKVKIARRKREEVIPIARRRPVSCQEERRVRIGGEGGTGGWKRKVAITIAKEIKDARVKKIKKSYVPASIHHIQKTKNNNFNSQIAA